MLTQPLLVLARPPQRGYCTTALRDRRSSRAALSQQVNPKVLLHPSEPPGSTSGFRDSCETCRHIDASRNLRSAPARELWHSAGHSDAAARYVLQPSDPLSPN
ncbi:hypothetical protein NDU88_002803 [Pleurodeles waltl]|uniref:Uncharacterized protein n=1 Tax=Pleurodeles waltl TaxID=8319 RepID=A0AAV7L032_PLEWA|nr:hypothetical protein NDU88_002803 [Pleurodeles waltl]